MDEDRDPWEDGGEDGTGPAVSVILPAAGEGSRFGGTMRKPWVELGGEPIVLRTIRRLRALPEIREILLAAHPADLPLLQGEWAERFESAGLTLAVAGGASRAESVWRALEVGDPECALVAVHDAVRPFAPLSTCRELFRVALRKGAAVPVVPVTDTIKRIEGDLVTETVRRHGLMRVQTPQVFRRELLLEANEFIRRNGGWGAHLTDDASIVEAAGHPVAAVLDHESNLKITTPEDLLRAEWLLSRGAVRD